MTHLIPGQALPYTSRTSPRMNSCQQRMTTRHCRSHRIVANSKHLHTTVQSTLRRFTHDSKTARSTTDGAQPTLWLSSRTHSPMKPVKFSGTAVQARPTHFPGWSNSSRNALAEPRRATDTKWSYAAECASRRKHFPICIETSNG